MTVIGMRLVVEYLTMFGCLNAKKYLIASMWDGPMTIQVSLKKVKGKTICAQAPSN